MRRRRHEARRKEFDCVRERSFRGGPSMRALQRRLDAAVERPAVLADFFFASLCASMRVAVGAAGRR